MQFPPPRYTFHHATHNDPYNHHDYAHHYQHNCTNNYYDDHNNHPRTNNYHHNHPHHNNPRTSSTLVDQCGKPGSGVLCTALVPSMIVGSFLVVVFICVFVLNRKRLLAGGCARFSHNLLPLKQDPLHNNECEEDHHYKQPITSSADDDDAGQKYDGGAYQPNYTTLPTDHHQSVGGSEERRPYDEYVVGDPSHHDDTHHTPY
eukprot:GFYU01031171.1.p1 GENE.GFYU01031171.1~~GFYU01031171.1.p1  ORF type:complete len:203 (-),score=23.35 GFYU01031171.1:166-774(-)